MDPAPRVGSEPSARTRTGPWQRALIWTGADAMDRPLFGLGRYERLLLNLARYGITEVAWARPAPDIEVRLALSPFAERLPSRVEWTGLGTGFGDEPLLVVHSDALFDLLILPWFAQQIGVGLDGVLETSDGDRRPAMVSVHSAATLAHCVDFETAASRARGVSVTPPRGYVCLRVPTGARPRAIQQLWPMARKAGERWNLRETRRWTFPLSAALADRRVDPNTITWASLWIGVAGCVLLAFGGYAGRIAGAALIYGSWIVDCLDGAVSRLTYQASAAGARLDTVLGRWVCALAAAALGWAAFGARGAWKQALFAIVVMVAGGFLSVVAAGKAEGIPAPARRGWRFHLWTEQVLNLDTMLVLVLFAAIDHVVWFVWLAIAVVHVSWVTDVGVLMASNRTKEQA